MRGHGDKSDHYRGQVEPIDLIVASGFGEGFCAGNVIKYVARYFRKGGLEDLNKANDYLQTLITLVKGKEDQ